MARILRVGLPDRVRREDGVAVIVALMALSLLLALALAMILTAMTERRIASGYRQSSEALYAAEAAVERVLQDVEAVQNWDDILNGNVTSGFVDGPPAGMRRLPGGTAFDLTTATNRMRCGKTVCNHADLVDVTDDRPWGSNNPVWQPFAYGPIEQMAAAGSTNSQMYVVVWIADDPSETDDDPLRDGGPPVGCDVQKDPACADANAGRGVIAMLAQAVAPDGTQRTIEVTVARTDRRQGTGLRTLSWRHDR